MTDNDPCPHDTNGDGDCGRKTCARCYPQYQPLPEPDLLTALILDLTRMYGIIRLSFSDVEWRWVLPANAVDLLRDDADTLGVGHLDGEATVFGVPVRADEHATQPMIELRR